MTTIGVQVSAICGEGVGVAVVLCAVVGAAAGERFSRPWCSLFQSCYFACAPCCAHPSRQDGRQRTRTCTPPSRPGTLAARREVRSFRCPPRACYIYCMK